MGIKLDISVETPLTDDDRDILAGISVMVLAIANRQNLAEQDIDLPRDDDEPRACGAASEKGLVCDREDGHRGRHRYRSLDLAVPDDRLN